MNHSLNEVEKEIKKNFYKFYGERTFIKNALELHATAVRKEVAEEILGQLGAFKNSEGLWWVAHPQEVPNIRQRFLGSGEEGK